MLIPYISPEDLNIRSKIAKRAYRYDQMQFNIDSCTFCTCLDSSTTYCTFTVDFTGFTDSPWQSSRCSMQPLFPGWCGSQIGTGGPRESPAPPAPQTLTTAPSSLQQTHTHQKNQYTNQEKVKNGRKIEYKSVKKQIKTLVRAK